MKQLKLFAVAIICILLICTIATTGYIVFNKQEEHQKPFYVGVTYCGSSIQEAKELIDKVKNYTNLFVLQSGPLSKGVTSWSEDVALNEIGDYACAANLNYAVYCSTTTSNGYWINSWAVAAKERWGEQFIGIYYYDEPGGNMLDNGDIISWQTTTNGITIDTRKETDGTIKVTEDSFSMPNNSSPAYTIYYSDGGNKSSASMTYHPDGKITSFTDYSTEEIFEQYTNSLSEETQPTNGTIIGSYKHNTVIISYYPNGTTTIYENIIEGTMQHIIKESYEYNAQKVDDTVHVNNVYTPENITKYSGQISSYEKVLKQHPIQTIDDATELFVNANNNSLGNINKEQLQEKSILVFTSDYGLYWWDYKSGYDMILAELGWNHTTAQDIALIRGAANMQNKSWGTIITWKYTHPPYLTNGEEMFEQLKTSYQAGAEYVIIFNYSEDPENPNTLQEEHFLALEQFWNNIVQNPKIKHNNIKVETALVLPQNYGWGIRHPKDNIWGIWPADNTSQQIWNQLQDKIQKHGLKLDIIFEDPDFPIADKYSNIYYWDKK